MFSKIFSGGDTRKSRLHTENDVFIGFPQAISELPKAIAQKTHNKFTGRRPPVPWWPMKAISYVEKHLQSDMKAIEFGSGSSTLWIAQRVEHVIIREHDHNWAKKTENLLASNGARNWDMELRTGQDYFALPSCRNYDFAVVDGEYRWKCLEALESKMNSGGLIYFDNADSDKDEAEEGEVVDGE